MSDLDKINIYVPDYIGVQLDYDASLFEILRKDRKTINRNRFLSMMILGYYNAYVSECQNAYNTIMAELVDHGVDSGRSHEIADSILKKVVLPQVPSRKGRNPTRLSLKPTKDTEGLIINIMKDLGGNDFISQYFCRMLMSYCEKSFSEREQIVFRDKYELLKSACDCHRSVSFTTIWNPKLIHEVIPYKLAIGKEEMFNYILCAEFNENTGKQEAKTFRLNRLSNINYIGRNSQIDEIVLGYLEKMIKYGPQYMINDDEESCVRLTESGRKNFSRIYYGRPQIDRIEEKPGGDYYFFKGSKDQVFFYFRRFGYDDAEIIAPEILRKRMADFHQKAYEGYS